MSMTDFKCINCGAQGHFSTISAAAAAGWDWFRGYAPRELEFCPRCRNSPKRHELYKRSRNPVEIWKGGDI